MPHIYPQTYFANTIRPLADAHLNITTSAILYGLSVYTVFPVHTNADGKLVAFRLKEHFERLVNSARIIGIDTFEAEWDEPRFLTAVKELIAANDVKDKAFVRVTIHVDEMVPGTRSRGLHTVLSMFIYEALPIVPQDGARLKTSVWRRIPDYAIPSRAKVNGAYVNSVLAKQDALDSGYDDCIFLDAAGHVCELSAANIFMVRNGVLVTPGTTSDLLEGINRRTILEIAEAEGLTIQERDIDLTELYIADEVFACGTSAYLAPIVEIDARRVGDKTVGPVTRRLSKRYFDVLHGRDKALNHYLTALN
ncbi:aminotransferase class IV [Candidatus Saccharibacteria bacterium]|nr:aminotransferase class IV [Candidatus Saccharibacteria bacterium]